MVPTKSIAHVEQRGTGPVPVVLIPGINCDWTVYESFMERNKDRYTMYAVTLPGFGGTEPPPSTKDDKPSDGAWLDNAEAAIFEVMVDKKLENPLVIGHSLGGYLAIRLLEHHPDLLRGAVTIDGHPAIPLSGPGMVIPIESRRQIVAERMVPQLNAMSDDQWKMMATQLSSMVKDKERGRALIKMSQAVPREISQRYLLELLSADAGEELKDLQKPLLFIIALADFEAEPGAAVMAKDAFTHQYEGVPKSTVVFFEDTRHFVMDDAPAELDRAVRQFVEEKPVAGKLKPAAKASAAPGSTGGEAPKQESK